MFKFSISSILSFISPRELAMLVFFLLLFIFMFKSSPKNLIHLLKALMSPKLIIVFLGGIVYLVLWVLLLAMVGLWEMSLLKETFVYIVTSTALVAKSIDIPKNKNLFINQVWDNIKITTIIAYIINLYSFPFWMEMLLLITISFFVMIQTFAKSKDAIRYEGIIKIANRIVNLCLWVYLIGFMHWLTENWHDVFSKTNFYCLLLPVVLGIIFIPYMYVIALYSSYELIFTRIKVSAKNTGKDCHFRKKIIFKTCGLNLNKIIAFDKKFNQYGVVNNQDFERFVKIVAEKM